MRTGKCLGTFRRGKKLAKVYQIPNNLEGCILGPTTPRSSIRFYGNSNITIGGVTYLNQFLDCDIAHSDLFVKVQEKDACLYFFGGETTPIIDHCPKTLGLTEEESVSEYLDEKTGQWLPAEPISYPGGPFYRLLIWLRLKKPKC